MSEPQSPNSPGTSQRIYPIPSESPYSPVEVVSSLPESTVECSCRLWRVTLILHGVAPCILMILSAKMLRAYVPIEYFLVALHYVLFAQVSLLAVWLALGSPLLVLRLACVLLAIAAASGIPWVLDESNYSRIQTLYLIYAVAVALGVALPLLMRRDLGGGLTYEPRRPIEPPWDLTQISNAEIIGWIAASGCVIAGSLAIGSWHSKLPAGYLGDRSLQPLIVPVAILALSTIAITLAAVGTTLCDGAERVPFSRFVFVVLLSLGGFMLACQFHRIVGPIVLLPPAVIWCATLFAARASGYRLGAMPPFPEDQLLLKNRGVRRNPTAP